MGLLLECIIVCLLMWVICYCSTGSDMKNLTGLRSYPDEVQKVIRANDKYKDKVKPVNLINIFISNLILFTVVLFIFGLFIKTNNFYNNFLNILILGEVLNTFDLVVIDLLWWRNTKRIWFSELAEKKYYQNPKQHIDSFLRGIVMYLMVAIIDGLLLTII